MIKNLRYPDRIKEKLLGFVKHVNSTENFAHLLLVGCEIKYVTEILESFCFESNNVYDLNYYNSNAKYKIIDCKNKKVGDLIALLVEIEQDDFVCFMNLNELNIECNEMLLRAMEKLEIIIKLGNGKNETKFNMSLPQFNSIIVVENISQVPIEMKKLFYDIVDFKAYSYELWLMYVDEFEKDNNLILSSKVKNILAKRYVQFDQLNFKLLELRKCANQQDVKEINDIFFENTFGKINIFEKIDDMSGREFEIFTANLFCSMGYTNVVLTKMSNDFGADVIAEKDGVKFVIQCKRYNSPVSVNAVQEVASSKVLHECHVACVLTNSTFTLAARELANKNFVVLWDANMLKEFISRVENS